MANSSVSFAPDQIRAGADRALQLVEQAGPNAASLIEEWIKSANAAAVSTVAERGQGAARKAARRGLNVLKARGIAIPEAPRTGRIATSVESLREAWLLPPDSTGVEGVILAERLPTGSHQACFVFFRDGQNILRAQSGQLALSKIKENMQQSLGGAGYGPVSVPWEWAQYRIAERRAWHAARKVPEPLGLGGIERLLQGTPEAPPAHPFDEEGLALSDEDAARIARDSGVLHQWPEFRAWLPSERALQELLIQLGRRLGPEPPTSKEELDPLVREQVAAATDRYFTPERRAVLARRMKDSGLSVLARMGETAALQVSAVIHVIEGAGLITNPPSDVKFLTAYFDKAIALLAARQGGQLRIPIPRPPAKLEDAESTASGENASGETPSGEAAESAADAQAPDDDDPLAAEPGAARAEETAAQS